jgi:3-(3-hydroxy-phenyl)propionate hydroxylase
MGAESPQVLVVGAGPVGLSAALALSAKGLQVLVLEALSAEKPVPGSRAIFIHRESLAHLESASPGLGARLAELGVTWQTKRTFWQGKEVYERTYPSSGHRKGLPPFTSLSQARTEEVLREACKQASVEILYGMEVNEVTSSASGVKVSTARETFEAPYLIGADGARSVVRKQIGVEMEGSRSERAFVIIDVEENPDDPLPIERIYHYSHPAVQGRNVLLVPFAGGWRADLQCRLEDDPEAFSSEEGSRAWLSAVMPEGYANRMRWVSTYQFLQVVADRFLDASGRVALIGEAAHLFAPFGARGMNSGIADAVSVANAVGLAMADPGQAARAMEAFAMDRREAALFNRAAAGRALAHMEAADLVTRAKRNLAARLASYGRRAGEWLDSGPFGPRGGRSGSGRRPWFSMGKAGSAKPSQHQGIY